MTRALIIATLAAAAAVAQNPVTADAPFQVRYVTNLNVAPPGSNNSGSVINITNTGATGNTLFGPGFGAPLGNICVNVYLFDPDEEMAACCSCLVTPNGLVSLDAFADLATNAANGVVPTSGVVKLVATVAGTAGGGTTCVNTAATVDKATLATGLAAWGTTLHAFPGGGYQETETPFTPATLSAGERASLANRCTAITGNLSFFGQCRSCRFGGL